MLPRVTRGRTPFGDFRCHEHSHPNPGSTRFPCACRSGCWLAGNHGNPICTIRQNYIRGLMKMKTRERLLNKRLIPAVIQHFMRNSEPSKLSIYLSQRGRIDVTQWGHGIRGIDFHWDSLPSSPTSIEQSVFFASSVRASLNSLWTLTTPLATHIPSKGSQVKS